MKKVLFLIAAAILTLSFSMTASADDYYNYGGPGNLGIGFVTGAAGFVDTQGKIEGKPGGQYVFVAGSSTSYQDSAYGYIYRVDTVGDPNRHPLNPDDPGPIATRTFTKVSGPNLLGYFGGVHENEFHVDNSGIYFGASRDGLFHWDFGWTNKSLFAPAAPVVTQTLAYDALTGKFWAGGTYRDMYMYNGTAWVYQGTYPDLGGNHHDGLEIVSGKLFASDMTVDKMVMYNLPVANWNTPDKTFNFSGVADVEGMGFGPNQHFWIAGWNDGSFYEIGGGKLQHEVVPEPATMLLLGSGLIGLAGYGRKKFFKK
jgi:hypothetical protein